MRSLETHTSTDLIVYVVVSKQESQNQAPTKLRVPVTQDKTYRCYAMRKTAFDSLLFISHKTSIRLRTYIGILNDLKSLQKS